MNGASISANGIARRTSTRPIRVSAAAAFMRAPSINGEVDLTIAGAAADTHRPSPVARHGRSTHPGRTIITPEHPEGAASYGTQQGHRDRCRQRRRDDSPTD